MSDAWEMHQAETGLNPGPAWRDRGVIINTLTERNQALEERVAELEGSCQKLRDDYQGALAETQRLRRWKSEATEVILGLQDVGRELGLPLGTSITGSVAADAAKQLKAERDAALANRP